MTASISKRIMILLFFVLFVATGCQTTYYTVWEKLGKEKRHLLKGKVEEVRSEQAEASEEFQDVMTRIKEMYGFEGGDLEKFYRQFKSDYEGSNNRAASIHKRIGDVEQIASDLFNEWQKEINEISSQKLRNQSASSLRATKQRYAKLKTAMKKSEASMEPVLKRLKDYLLYLKHNLNAKAIGAIKQEVTDIENEVSILVKDMEKSIKEADRFLKTLD